MIKINTFTTKFIDHLGKVYFPHNPLYGMIGRLSFPFLTWDIARGYVRKTSYVRYAAARLLALTIISQIPCSLLFDNHLSNICFSLLAGQIALKIVGSPIPQVLNWVIIRNMLNYSQAARLNYRGFGILTINDNLISSTCRQRIYDDPGSMTAYGGC